MDSMISIGDAVLLMLGICGVVFLIYLIRAVAAMLPGLRSLSGVLEDTKQLTGMAADAATSVEDAVLSASETTEEMAEFFKNNQSTIKAVVSLINAIVAIKKLLS